MTPDPDSNPDLHPFPTPSPPRCQAAGAVRPWT